MASSKTLLSPKLDASFRFRQSGVIRDRKSLRNNLFQCFEGSEFVNWIIENEKSFLGREVATTPFLINSLFDQLFVSKGAICLGQTLLLDDKLRYALAPVSPPVFSDDSTLYRYSCDEGSVGGRGLLEGRVSVQQQGLSHKFWKEFRFVLLADRLVSFEGCADNLSEAQFYILRTMVIRASLQSPPILSIGIEVPSTVASAEGAR